MAVNKLLPFANGVGANVTDYATWSALSTLLSQGFTTGVARSDYANRVFAQGALASYILGQFVVDQTEQDADLNESVFYTNFKNALLAYIKANSVTLNTTQTIGGTKTFSTTPKTTTATAGDNSTKVATTAFVKTAIDNSVNSVKAVSYGEQTLTDAEKAQARTNIGAAADSEVVKLTGDQTVAGVKTFSSSPIVPTPTSGDDSTKVATTAYVQAEIASTANASEVVKLTGNQTIAGTKTFSSSPIVPTIASRFDQSQTAVNSAWAYGLATQGNALELVDLGTPDDIPWDEIDAGNFRNCPVGGYVTANSHRYYLGHHNYWLHTGDTECTTNHILVVPAGNLVSGQMNSTNTTTGGYAGCDFKTGNNGNTKLAELTAIINADWGASHILSHSDYFTNAVSNGYPSGVTGYDSTIDLMSEPMVYGCKIFEPIGNGSLVPSNYTLDKSQIKLFSERPDLITIRAYWWLRGVVSAADFARVSLNGSASYAYASLSIGFRPAFGICKSNP